MLISYGILKDGAHSFFYLFNKCLSTHHTSRAVPYWSPMEGGRQKINSQLRQGIWSRRVHKLQSITMHPKLNRLVNKVLWKYAEENYLLREEFLCKSLQKEIFALKKY